MKDESKSKRTEMPSATQKPALKIVDEAQRSASGKWGATHRVRLPHRAGLPLSSGGCGDQIER